MTTYFFFEIGRAGQSDDLLFFEDGRAGAQSQPRSRKPQEWTRMTGFHWFYKGFACIPGPPSRPMTTYYSVGDDLVFGLTGWLPGPEWRLNFFLRSRGWASDDLISF